VAPPPPVSAADRAYAAGAAALAEGNHERSLEMFASAWKENPEHPGVARDFPEALSRLKNGGEESFRQGRIEESGRRWSAALRYSAILAEKGRQPPFARTELRAGIDRVSAALMEKGLIEYRKGNLESAIALWKSILAYDPSHEEAARSVKTASTQLENLKKISPSK
jgi:tetratricopeptide (TPR) repeat protein